MERVSAIKKEAFSRRTPVFWKALFFTPGFLLEAIA
jgi:hypothetical protein